ncbi:MAG: PEP-CTERM sorting domain-containing protein [Acidobacteriaceae bacterium]|nr:PEP-CTERM sorting domain-containing protein [Acidobacteriaceae bacterium]
MKTTLSVLAIAVLAIVVPAHATVYSVDFQGIVNQTQGATGQALGNTVTGHFDLDSSSGNFLDFTIAGKSVAAGYSSSAVIVPPFTEAIYTAQVSPVSSGGSTNSTFTLDLSSLSSWPATVTAYTLLTNTAQLTTNLDTINNPSSTFPSTFGYYTANASGNNIAALNANLTSVTATAAVPEPASLALLGSSVLGLVLFIRRRA